MRFMEKIKEVEYKNILFYIDYSHKNIFPRITLTIGDERWMDVKANLKTW